jgi:chaperone modulatory protein CbpM
MWSREEFCLRAGIAQTTLQVWVEEGWLVPRAGDADLLLSEIDLARARLIRDLREEIGVNDEGIGVILSLLDQVHGLRSVLFDLRRQLGSTKPRAGE